MYANSADPDQTPHANSVDPDQTPHSAASDLGLHCLHRAICPNTQDYYGISFCRRLLQ